MTIPIIAFFNNKGGVGKTSLVYHLAWMYSQLGLRVVAADLDPQANLTTAFLDEDRLEEFWFDAFNSGTIFEFVQPLKRGIGDIASPTLEFVTDRLALLAGDLALSSFEDTLSEVWPKCMDRDERAFRITSAFWRLMQEAALQHNTDVILLDLGPNLGAINRAALIASDYVVIPLAPDIFSLQGLRNLGPTLRSWRQSWSERLDKNPIEDLKLPEGEMQPVGYIVLQHSIRLDRPVQAYERWMACIPNEYRQSVLGDNTEVSISLDNDPHKLASLKHYRSLMAMAQESHKPIFLLKPADGALGSHYAAVKAAYTDFERLAQIIAERIGLRIPEFQ
jgi:chromosome partitioning protein